MPAPTDPGHSGSDTVDSTDTALGAERGHLARSRAALARMRARTASLDTEYAAHRQRFLAEQGYAYKIVDADDLVG